MIKQIGGVEKWVYCPTGDKCVVEEIIINWIVAENTENWQRCNYKIQLRLDCAGVISTLIIFSCRTGCFSSGFSSDFPYSDSLY